MSAKDVKECTKSVSTLLVLCVIISMLASSGCVPGFGGEEQMPQKPVKPVLGIERTDSGGVRLDKENTEKLMQYIRRLEEGYSK